MSPQAGWSLVHEISPRIAGAVARSVNHVGCEDSEELAQDGVCMAAKILASAERRGKAVTPGNVAYFALQHLKSGRRSYGTSSTDPMHPATQIKRGARLCSFEDPVKEDECGGEPLTLAEVFSVQTEDPATAAARKLDWETFLSSIDPRTKAVIECLIAGRPLSEVAEKFKVSLSTASSIKRQLAVQLREFMGPEVLAEIQALPLWKSSLTANREKQACREEQRG